MIFHEIDKKCVERWIQSVAVLRPSDAAAQPRIAAHLSHGATVSQKTSTKTIRIRIMKYSLKRITQSLRDWRTFNTGERGECYGWRFCELCVNDWKLLMNYWFPAKVSHINVECHPSRSQATILKQFVIKQAFVLRFTPPAAALYRDIELWMPACN